jgi:diaminohydroxyphosphoribosylaminopyrimidine deaminase / 5-amino-6-(5-phosphoribosylamino)uracil reductase
MLNCSMNNQHFMQIALNIAKRGKGKTAENPSVGCVIVRGDQIIAASRSNDLGRPHAEPIALAQMQQSGISAEDCQLYVTLEPCSHYGKTPPCVNAIINSGIKSVNIACLDNDARVAGLGVVKLREAGIKVEVGMFEAQAKSHHHGFLRRIKGGLPHLTLKIATSYDQKITTGTAEKWLTNSISRQYVHVLRANHDAVISGIGTVLTDNPMLDCRLNGLQQYSPIRVILDRNLRIPMNCQLAQTANKIKTIILTSSENINKINELKQDNIEIINLKPQFALIDVLQYLSEIGVNSAMIEAGQGLNQSAFESRLIDELYWFKSDNYVGESGITALKNGNIENHLNNAKLLDKLYFANDVLLHYQFFS